MKKNAFLRKLLSAVCCVAMLVTMLPIIPAAAAGESVFFEDNFTNYTAGAFDTAVAQAHGYQMTKASGSPAVSIVSDGGNQVLSITGARPYIKMGKPEGTYTMQFDVKRNAASSGLFEIWMADIGNNKTIRFRVHENGSFGFVETAGSKNFLVQNDGGFSNGGYNANRTDSGNAIMEANTWYHVEFVADPEENTVKLTVRERDNASATVYVAERTMPNFDNYNLQMDGQDFTANESKINVSIDNIKVVSGAVEAQLPSTPAVPGGTAISGGSLNNFSDAAEITYTKAAEVTSGLKLFEGADGKFMPKNNVTRAQMATIIVKMLYGSDVNADSFKGTGKFSDTASFEGGWAEGYINWCSTLGVVAGYGDGTFKPGNNVTAAEAATMILNALKVDAGEGTWPHTVMAKAEELDMFDDLDPKPANDKALTREELAVMALVGLEYSPEGTTGYEYNGVVYDSYFDALLVAGDASKITPASKDTLASQVFEMKTVEGYITGNQATGLDFTEINGAVPFAIETGLEHIGHYVEVYYAEEYESEDEPGLTYTIYDETKVYEVKDEDIDTAKEYKALFGKNYRLNSNGVALFNGQYEMTDGDAADIPGYVVGSYAPMGTYFVYEGAIVGYMAPVTVYAAQVLAVNKYEGSESIELSSKKAPISNAENDDCIVEYKGIKEDDYVTYTMVGSGADAIYVLSKAKAVTGSVTKLTNDENGNRVVTIKGKQYVAFGSDNNTTGLNTGDVTDFNASYTYYVTEDGKYLGWKNDTGAADLSDAVFILGELTTDKADSYGKITRTVYARGIDMEGKEALLPIKIVKGEYNKTNKDFDSITETITDPNCEAITPNTFYYVKDATDRDAKKEGLSVLTAITSEYDEETMPIYYGTYDTVAGGTFVDNALIINGVYSYKTSSTLYITMDGDVNQGEPLTATVAKGSWTQIPNNTGLRITRHILLSKADNGSVNLEAIVLHVPDANVITSGSTVYFSDAAASEVSRSADGYVYTVHNYNTGDTKQITMANPVETYDSWTGGAFYQILPVDGTDAFELSDKIAGGHNSTNSSNSASDGLYYENVFYDQFLFDMGSTYFNTLPVASFGTAPTNTASYGIRVGKGAAGATVVDLRSEDEITAAGVGKIDSMDRINNLTQRDKDMVILLDMCYSTRSDKLAVVYVKDVYYTAANGVEMSVEGGKYYINGYAVADNCEVIDQSASGVRDLDDIYDLLNPAESAPGYPPAEPAAVEIEYAVTNGQITSVTVTAVLQAGVFVDENFESFDNGTVDANVAKAHGYVYTVASGTPELKVETVGGSKVLTNVTKRPYLTFGVAEGAYTLSFDVMRPVAGTDGGLMEIWFGTVGTGTMRFRLWDNGAFGVIDSTLSKMNFLMQNGGGFSAGGLNASRDEATNAKLSAGTWYTVKMVVDPDTKAITLTVSERDNAGGDSWTASKIMPNAFVNGDIKLDGNTDLDVYLDNIKCVAVSDWQYPVTVVQPAEGGSVSADVSGAATGEIVNLSYVADTNYAFKWFLVNGQPIVGDTYTMGADPITVSAVFERGYNVTLTQPAQGGTITADPVFAASEATVTVTATPAAAHWALESVTATGASGSVTATVSGNTATFKMPAEDVTVTATFKDASVLVNETFDSYSGSFINNAAAKANGWSYGGSGGTVTVENGTGTNKFITITGARPYMYPYASAASGAYTIKFDFRRNAELSGLFEIHIADVGGAADKLRFRVHQNGAFGVNDATQSGSKTNFLMQTNQTFSTGGQNNTHANTGNALLKANTWYTITVMMDAETDAVTVSAVERDNASGDSWTATKVLGDLTNRKIHIDPQNATGGAGDSAINVSVDNLEYRLVVD